MITQQRMKAKQKNGRTMFLLICRPAERLPSHQLTLLTSVRSILKSKIVQFHPFDQIEMNVLLCAQILMIITDPSMWTECVLGHQDNDQVCVCYEPNPTIVKCTKKRRCEVS